MSTETSYSRSSNFVRVEQPEPAASHQPEPMPDKDERERNYKAGAWVLSFVLTCLGFVGFKALGPGWMAAGGAAGGGLAWGAHRLRTGAADARHRRRMGIARTGRAPRTAVGRALRRTTDRLPRSSRMPSPRAQRSTGMPPGGSRGGAGGRGPAAGKAPGNGAVMSAASGGLLGWFKKRRAARRAASMPDVGSAASMPSAKPGRRKPRAPRRAEQRAAQEKANEVSRRRRGHLSRAWAHGAAAANHVYHRQWWGALCQVVAMVWWALARLLVGPQPDERSQRPAPAFTERKEPKKRSEKPGVQDALSSKDTDAVKPPSTAGDAHDDHLDTDRAIPPRGSTPVNETPATNVPLQLHPCQEELERLHALMFQSVAHSVPNQLEHLDGLGVMYEVWGGALTVFSSHVDRDLPIGVQVSDMLGLLNLQMTQHRDIAYEVSTAYESANIEDIERHRRPLPNEEFRDVPYPSREGTDMNPIRLLVQAAGLEIFNYRPTNPLDLLAYFTGLPGVFYLLATHVDWALEHGSFPGAGAEIGSFWNALSTGYEHLGDRALAVAEMYQDAEAWTLFKWLNPRQDEALTNVAAARS